MSTTRWSDFRNAVVLFGVLEVLSWVSFRYGFMTPTLVTTAVVLLALAVLKPHWLGWISWGELLVGGKGYLLFGSINGSMISLRYVIFAALLVAAISVWRQTKPRPHFFVPRPLLFFGLWLAVATGIALAHHFPPGRIFTDLNGFLYLGVVPLWWLVIRRDPLWRERALAIFLAAITIIGVKTWLLAVMFGENGKNLLNVYKWVRQTGIGEITYIQRNIYRIFFQSHIYMGFGLLLSLAGLWSGRSARWWAWPAMASALGLYLSLSRSLWIGTVVGLVIITAWLIRSKQDHKVKKIFVVPSLALFVWLMVSWSIHFPYVLPPKGGGGGEQAVIARLSGIGSQQAADARLNQLKPLWSAIRQQPIVGQGFGAMVTYYSTDPRVKGWRMTSAFELGYLDLWLKIGVVGLLLLGWWLLTLLKKLYRTKWNILLAPSVVALLVIHLSTPYLNHPLGLGWLALLMLYAYDPE